VSPSGHADIAALPPGHALQEYRIDKVLGGGGFGITYLAQDSNLQLPVAIKEFFPSSLVVRDAEQQVLGRNDDADGQFQWGLERFIDEARALASFRHPHIVRVLRYFKANGTAYIVMEYESGQPLPQWLSRNRGMDQAGLLRIVYPLLDGLDAVHKLEFLHRDIKPDNIYIRADGSPVLLDFGAARRVTGHSDVTNIVSPGFAPFEQYHSRGNQGPWTDIYSLGAVMYWMTTGKKPMDSAARVRDDALPKAAKLGSRATFGEQLLQAIDWALTPDETLRPRNVAAFRTVLQQSEHVVTRVLTESAPVSPTATSAPTTTQVPTGVLSAEDALRKNVMGTIMFLDLVAYSTHSVDQQVAIKTLFNELINKAIGGVDPMTRILLDTGDGAAICFLGDPEEALRSALILRDLLVQKYGQKLSMRVGLHMGPVRMLMDINNRVNVVGDGINVAQRIMDFSSANQITVSRAYYEVISRISDGAERMFEYLGPRFDKHKRAHEIYALADTRAIRPAEAPPAAPSPAETATQTTIVVQRPLDASELQSVESDLTRIIGPLAQVLVRKAEGRYVDAQALRELLSVSIQDALARDAFVHPKAPKTSAGVPSQPAPLVSRTLGQTTVGPVSALRSNGDTLPPAWPHSGTGPSSVSTGSVSGLQSLSADQVSAIEKALSQHIGPLARTLVRKEAARHPHASAVLQALAKHIDREADQVKFLQVANKVLGRSGSP
jgi:serine/threonine protein kinase